MPIDSELSERGESTTPVLTRSFRILGILPLGFFLAHAYYYWVNGGLPHLLWMCNVANLALAIGLFTASPGLIRVAVIWLIPGLPLWFVFVVLQGGWLFTSTVAHLGGLAVGLFALKRVRASKTTWIWAIAWYLVMQQICRMFTPVDHNVNVAHRPYEGMEQIFGSYFEYWLATTAMVVVGAWILGFALLKLLPPPGERGLRRVI